MSRQTVFTYPFESPIRVQDFAHALAADYFERHHTQHGLFTPFDDAFPCVLHIVLSGNFSRKVEEKRKLTFHQQMRCAFRGRGYWRAYLAARDAGTLPDPLPSTPVKRHCYDEPTVKSGDWKMTFSLRYASELKKRWDGIADWGDITDDQLVIEMEASVPVSVMCTKNYSHWGQRALWILDHPWNPRTDHPDGLIADVEAAVKFYAEELEKVTSETEEVVSG